MEFECLPAAAACVAIGDLIGLYRTLDKAHSSLVGAEAIAGPGGHAARIVWTVGNDR